MKLIITQSPSIRIVLTAPKDFQINPSRMSSERTAVAGNVIRQLSTLHASSARPVFSGPVRKADADALETMHSTSSSVRIFWRNHQYSATMAVERGEWNGRFVQMRLTFSITREIV